MMNDSMCTECTEGGAKMTEAVENAQFPDRVVLAVGYPWAEGLGTKANTYSSAMMMPGPRWGTPKSFRFPRVLWSPELPQYRLVLERVSGRCGKAKRRTTHDTGS